MNSTGPVGRKFHAAARSAVSYVLSGDGREACDEKYGQA